MLCKIDGIETKALWDTGSQVSILPQVWLNRHFPGRQLKNLGDLLSEELTLKAANGTSIGYVGWVEVGFCFVNGNSEDCLKVPVLVTEEPGLETPLIGFNVIEEYLVRGRCGTAASTTGKSETMVNLIRHALPDRQKLHAKRVVSAMNRDDTDVPCIVRTSRKRINIRANSTSLVSCNVLPGECTEGMILHLEPLENSRLPYGLDVAETVVELGKHRKVNVIFKNSTKHDISVFGRTEVGMLNLVAEISPMALAETDNHDGNQKVSNQETSRRDDFRLSGSNLDERQKQKVLHMLNENNDIFTQSDDDIGCLHGLEMDIKLKDEEPVQKTYCSIPRPLYQEVKDYLQNLIQKGWITQSRSNYSSPIVCVRKKSGDLRLCIDYRQLNAKTIRDRQPLPRIQDVLESLAGNSWFTVLDQGKAYHQGFVKQNSRHLTAFITPWGLYEWERIPFGLTNAPAAFQRHMNECLGDLRDKICLPYIDDVIIYSPNFEQHLKDVKLVLGRLKEAGAKLRAPKCSFFQREVKYLGHVVSENGYRADPEDIKAVVKLKDKIPETVGEVRRLMGFLGYYRRFIPNFSRKAKVIYDLLKLPQANPPDKNTKRNAKQKRVRRTKVGQAPSNTPVQWTSEHRETLESLIDILTRGEVMAYANFEKPFILHTDASCEGLGAVLYQKQDDGVLRVIGYGSRTLSPSEKNYFLHSGKLEFLALKWAITDRFRDYLYYAPSFCVYSDNNPLTYVLSTARLDATRMRWIAELADFNFTIKYRPGRANGDADGLSRMSLDMSEVISSCTEELNQDAISALIRGAQHHTVQDTDVVDEDPAVMGISTETISKDDIRLAQQSDTDFKRFFELREQKTLSPKEFRSCTPRSTALLRQRQKLQMVDGVLYRNKGSADAKTTRQLVLPERFRDQVLKELHINMGHPSKDRTLNVVRDRFYWPQMEFDVETFISRCSCQKSKRPTVSIKAPMQTIHATTPFEIVSLDFLHLDKSKSGHEYVLVIMDYFTRFVQCYPTKDKSGKTAADRLFNDYILRFGFPSRIHHDQGGEFENKLFQRLQQYSGIASSRTTPYHPQGNGQVERYNRTLLGMLKTLPESHKSAWNLHLNKMTHAYNCIRHDATGYTPFFLMFGRSPRLPVDILFNLEQTGESRDPAYVSSWKKGMEEVFKTATESAMRTSSQQKKQYDKKIRHTTLLPGDRVLVRNLSERGGTGKLRNFWEESVHVVEKQISVDSPVYRVRPENGKGPTRVLHRNLLMSCDSLPIEEPITAGRKERQNKRKAPRNSETTTEQSSDEEDEFELLPTANPSSSIPLNPHCQPFVPRQASPVRQEIDPVEVEMYPEDQDTGVDHDQHTELARPIRTRRPPMRLTYDEHGRMQEYPQTYCIGCNRPHYLPFVPYGIQTYLPKCDVNSSASTVMWDFRSDCCTAR